MGEGSLLSQQIQMLISSRNRQTRNNVSQISGHPVVWSSWPRKLATIGVVLTHAGSPVYPSFNPVVHCPGLESLAAYLKDQDLVLEHSISSQALPFTAGYYFRPSLFCIRTTAPPHFFFGCSTHGVWNSTHNILPQACPNFDNFSPMPPPPCFPRNKTNSTTDALWRVVHKSILQARE